VASEDEQVEDGNEVDRATRTRYILMNVRQFPDPVLKMQTNEVAVYDEVLRSLSERMLRIMESAHGVGLAAPQIGVLQRVLVYQADEGRDPVVLVNARVVERGDELDTFEEGCLSLGAAMVTMDVERPTRITVEANTVDGQPLRFEAESFEARVIQHEIDHLDGILILDRAAAGQRRAALGKLRPEPVLGPLY